MWTVGRLDWHPRLDTVGDDRGNSCVREGDASCARTCGLVAFIFLVCNQKKRIRSVPDCLASASDERGIARRVLSQVQLRMCSVDSRKRDNAPRSYSLLTPSTIWIELLLVVERFPVKCVAYHVGAMVFTSDSRPPWTSCQ